jgi:protein-arginine kinase activator protein McsA
MSGRFKKGQGFIDLTGERYGMLTVLEFVGQDKHKRSKWRCQCDCGAITEEFGAEMKHGSVKSCGCAMTWKRPRRVDLVEFLSRAKEKHGERYDYSSVEYKNTSTHVNIRCHDHGIFAQTPTQHYRGGQGCPKCAYEEKARAKRSNTETFVQEAKKRNGGNFDYSLVHYSDSQTPVEVICKTCNTNFKQRPSVHLLGSGCPACANADKKERYTLSTEEYVEKAKTIFQDSEYCYKGTVYTYSKDKIEVFCNCCKSTFKIRADVHLRGHGCPCKTTHGFDFTRPGTLYILECGPITKIGITSHEVSRRIKDISRSYGVNFNLVTEFEVEDPRLCSDVETEMLRYLRSCYKQPNDKFDGYTECFYDVDQRDLINRLKIKLEVYDQ